MQDENTSTTMEISHQSERDLVVKCLRQLRKFLPDFHSHIKIKF